MLEVGITDAKRRAIYEAEKAAAKLGVLPDDPEKRRVIIERVAARLARMGIGWDQEIPEAVVRVDERGVARVIPKEQSVGWIRGLPAHKDSVDPTSDVARPGRSQPLQKPFQFSDPGRIMPVDPRVAAQRFYRRIREAYEKHGVIPTALVQELYTEGWKQGQPVPLAKLEAWCATFVNESNKRMRGR